MDLPFHLRSEHRLTFSTFIKLTLIAVFYSKMYLYVHLGIKDFFTQGTSVNTKEKITLMVTKCLQKHQEWEVMGANQMGHTSDFITLDTVS